ncbi:hypothetical protein [Arenibacter sp. F20364]|uniref:toxin-antitoxin system YwqK family antitoxin n=1 Tax=Arenibacter sp. F20364 TaxID=2926415 RepID=UPI001FF3C451|nr:hypothetical protein [Arenibacter sp. F20364]MCK0192723.1 hypothetical protein [Arenibacter sp. F20364]
MKQLLFIVLLSFSLNANHSDGRNYLREYYPNGALKAQGWEEKGLREGFWQFFHTNARLMEEGHYKKGIKSGYWYFYTPNGNLEKEGHYSNGDMTMWWLFYDVNGKIDHKCQLRKGIKDGYCLKYKDGKLISVVKYYKGQRIKEWQDFKSFKKENKLSDLR